MTRHVLLDNSTHRNLRVSQRYSAQFGDSVATVVTYPTEFVHLQREYPILFRKDAKTGEFLSVALLGFNKEENLFLDGDRWEAWYVPGVIARGPFLIGFQDREPVVLVDMDDPRVGDAQGAAVFDEHGETSYLKHVASILNGLHAGIAASKPMFEAFTALDLIEPVKLEIQITESEKYSLLGLFTINEQKLAALEGESLLRLNQAGFLHYAFFVLASLSNVKKLIDLKLKRRQGQRAGSA
jgi:hypothetical protein